MAAGFDWQEVGGSVGIAFSFLVDSSEKVKVPRRIRRRLTESRSPVSMEEIEAKLKEADLRRQQFHQWLSRKARRKPKSPSWSSQDEELGQRLEAKLYAAEQKRLSILAKAQMRLAKLDELRQTAKTEMEMRIEKEREELGTKVESRVQQAEANRKLLLSLFKQRRAAANERTTQSLMQKRTRDIKYKESVRAAISQKRVAAEKKRIRLLEAEKSRAHARVMQARFVAKSVYHQREIERSKMKDQLEDRLQRAKRQRAEYLRQRGSPQSLTRANVNKMQIHGDLLSRKLSRCWKDFLLTKKTTLALAGAYNALGINEESIRTMPFEQLAIQIESPSTLQTVKALLDRLEIRFQLLQSKLPVTDDIDHLLKRVASPNKRGKSSNSVRSRTKNVTGKNTRKSEMSKLPRYPVRAVLCAYMILGHPDAVFSGQGEREIALTDSAAKFVQAFELLIKIIIERSKCVLSPDITSSQNTFRWKLTAFDAAWRSYLYHFVAWKIKDARLLEDDLVRAACQLELSMMRTCKITSEGDSSYLTHDMKAIQKQVSEDQKLLREKVLHLSGNAGLERMDSALSDMRIKFFESKENGTPLVSPPRILSASSYSPTSRSLAPEKEVMNKTNNSNRVVRSLFRDTFSSPKGATNAIENKDDLPSNKALMIENEALVNEIVHGSLVREKNRTESHMEMKIKETMEKAFWDGVVESMETDEPDYERIVRLVKEVRDALCDMAPQSWRKGIMEVIDLEILSQMLESRGWDTDYLERILEYSLITIQKFSSPSKEEEIKKVHKNLLKKLAEITQDGDKSNGTSFSVATIRGLRTILEQIQVLKQEISQARLRIMEPIIKGPAGLDYLQKAFADHYGPPEGASSSLPLTARWLSSHVGDIQQEWDAHLDSLSILSSDSSSSSSSQGLPSSTPLHSGGNLLKIINGRTATPSHQISVTSQEQPECKGETIDLFIRIGLLKLSTQVAGFESKDLPETFRLNFFRLRAVQSEYQKILVTCTSMLILRQILLSENMVGGHIDMDSMVSTATKILSELLDTVPDVGVNEIIETICNSLSGQESDINPGRLNSRKEMMSNMLKKSLQSGDPVFSKVSHAVYVASRGIMLGGTGPQGQKLAQMALRRVGGNLLYERVVEAMNTLLVLTMISRQVHGPWYQSLVEKM